MNSDNREENKQKIICQWCGQPTELIWVHGHGQCSICGINVDECCRGEQCNFESQSDIQHTEENNGD